VPLMCPIKQTDVPKLTNGPLIDEIAIN